MICPIMSIRMIVWGGKYVECQEKDCMWYAKCKPKELRGRKKGMPLRRKNEI